MKTDRIRNTAFEPVPFYLEGVVRRVLQLAEAELPQLRGHGERGLTDTRVQMVRVIFSSSQLWHAAVPG